jgi:hypothetical protein
MGGHSIMAVNVMVAVEKNGIEFAIFLFQHSTVEKFAKLLTIKMKFHRLFSSS